MVALDSIISNWLFSLGDSVSILWVLFARVSLYVLMGLFLFVIFRYVSSLKKKIFFFLFWLLQVIVSWGIITQSFSFFLNRPRPFYALSFEPLFYTLSHTAAFPSGHTVVMVGLASLIYLINKKIGIWAGGIAVISALSRVVSGVHWFGDVVGGVVIGVGIFALIWTIWGSDIYKRLRV